ncbi:2TM domain-containing protein [Maribacter sp. 2308TA10-17]|uniref:2TM domain-containing protein n=1 Tax=Maribacter sp. 2308TA10-17 TaxID=3386276 RepID=UPI0039BD8BB9
MKSKNKQALSSFERAQKRVKDIKGFYGHLAAYVIVILIVLSTRGRFMSIDNTIFQSSEYLNWIDWNIFGTPIIWGIFLVMHGIRVFGKNPFLGKNWEERQIQKYMKKNA